MTKVVRREGLPTGHADRARVEQLLRGAVHSDMMLVQLKLRERKENPPSFLELLSKIRSEEEYETARMKLNTSVQRVHANPATDSRREDVEHLKSVVQVLKSMFTSMRMLQSQVVADSKDPRSLTTVPTLETDGEDAVAALRKQVKKLQKQMAGQKSKVSEFPATVHRVESSRPAHSDNRRQPSNDSDGNFCYRCGENGHFSAKCHNAENQIKVIQK